MRYKLSSEKTPTILFFLIGENEFWEKNKASRQLQYNP